MIQPTLRQRLIEKQHGDPYLVGKRRLIDVNQIEEFSLTADGGLLYHWRLCVPNEDLKVEILIEFVSKCLVCQQVKVPRQKPTGLLQPHGNGRTSPWTLSWDYRGRPDATQLYGLWLIGSQSQLTSFQGSPLIPWINGLSCT